jgi:UPF0755 protein
MKKIILIISSLIFLIVTLSIVSDIVGFGGKAVSVHIPSGSTGDEISTILKQEKVIRYKSLFQLFSRNEIAGFKSGVHPMKKNMGYKDAVRALKNSAASDNGIMVTIPEGYEMREIAKTLEEKGICSEKSFRAAAGKPYDYDFLQGLTVSDTYLEGYLYPETYEFLPNSGGEAVIRKMLSRFGEMLSDKYLKRLKELDLTLHEAVTLASIIEREAALGSERAVVSSVFHNRLKGDKYPYLQSCATVQYLLKERKSVLSTEDIKIDSPYNTYRYKGLPPGPIASPGEDSFSAALYPADTDYYFFVASGNGGHTFSKTYEEHLRAQEE